MVIPKYILWKHRLNMWIPQCAQCFLHFWRYNNIPWKPVCHWDFDILMWLLPSWCDFLPTRCYMGLMWLLPNWCDLNPSLIVAQVIQVVFDFMVVHHGPHPEHGHCTSWAQPCLWCTLAHKLAIWLAWGVKIDCWLCPPCACWLRGTWPSQNRLRHETCWVCCSNT